LASTGSDRRALLKAALLAPVAALLARSGMARDYSSPGEVFDAIDGLEADVATRLRGFQRSVPSSRDFVASVTADHARHRAARADFRRRLGLAPAPPPPGAAPAAEPDLERLRAAQEALVYAHAEGLPAIGDPFVVDALAHHMVDLSRHLTVTQLWIETES
jgi:hypothetical protein